jgi:Tol biopolymer transport system component
MAVPFDLARLKVTGASQPVLEDVPLDATNGNSLFSFSQGGSLVYIPASVVGGDRLLVWVDRDGKSQPVTDMRRRYAHPKLSPDGRRLAVTIQRGNQDVWVHETARGTLTRLTFGEGTEKFPLWTPDGRRLIFQSEQPIFDLYSKPADGSVREEALLTSQYDKQPSSFSPDGRVLAYVEANPDTLGDIWLLPLEGERKPQPFLRTQFDEKFPAFSPDGRWLAYQSNESGRTEIYVQEYPGPGAKQQVSIEGGTEPVWARSGRELFYRNGDKMMAVEIRTSPAFQAAKPHLLFEGEYEHFRNELSFDVTPDGQRFLMVKTPPEFAPRQINVVLNWFDELRRRVATRGQD